MAAAGLPSECCQHFSSNTGQKHKKSSRDNHIISRVFDYSNNLNGFNKHGFDNKSSTETNGKVFPLNGVTVSFRGKDKGGKPWQPSQRPLGTMRQDASVCRKGFRAAEHERDKSRVLHVPVSLFSADAHGRHDSPAGSFYGASKFLQRSAPVHSALIGAHVPPIRTGGQVKEDKMLRERGQGNDNFVTYKRYSLQASQNPPFRPAMTRSETHTGISLRRSQSSATSDYRTKAKSTTDYYRGRPRVGHFKFFSSDEDDPELLREQGNTDTRPKYNMVTVSADAESKPGQSGEISPRAMNHSDIEIKSDTSKAVNEKPTTTTDSYSIKVQRLLKKNNLSVSQYFSVGFTSSELAGKPDSLRPSLVRTSSDSCLLTIKPRRRDKKNSVRFNLSDQIHEFEPYINDMIPNE